MKENENVGKYVDLAKEQKKAVEHEGHGDTCYYWSTLNSPQRLQKRLEELEIRGITETIWTTLLLR